GRRRLPPEGGRVVVPRADAAAAADARHERRRHSGSRPLGLPRRPPWELGGRPERGRRPVAELPGSRHDRAVTEDIAVARPAARRAARLPLGLAAGAAAAAALGVALLAIQHVPETRTSPLVPDTHAWRVVLIAAVAAAFALYVIGLLALRSRTAAVGAVAVVAAVIQLAPLAAP